MLKTAGIGAALALTGGSLLAKGMDAIEAAAAELPYLALIVLDGARPDYFNVPGIPHVRSLIRNGTQYSNAFAGILESETPSGHVSIATGSLPRTNGILSFAWAASDNRLVDLFDPNKIRAGAMEAIVRQYHVPTIAGLVHTKSRNAKVVALSGSKYYAADALGGPDADVIMYFTGTTGGLFTPTYIPGHAPAAGVLDTPSLTIKNGSIPLGLENRLAMKLAVRSFNRTRQQVTLVNLPEFDWPLGHVNGGVLDGHGVVTLMQAFDRDLAMLQDAYRRAGVLDRTLFVLMADHGMMPLDNKVSDTALTDAASKAGTSVVWQSFSSGAYLWVKDASRAGQAAKNIAALRTPHVQSVYVKGRTKTGFSYIRTSSAKRLHAAGTEAANQYLLNTFAGPNGPDVVVLFTEHAGSEPGGQAGWKADHGGTSWRSQHIPLVLSGPGVRSGVQSSAPARLIDVAPTVLQAMGVPHQRMQGVVLADALTDPPAGAAQVQNATSRHLMPVVQALKSESHLELTAGR
jgi:hypothetical protein